MARWIGAVCCLLLVNVASGQLPEREVLAGHESEVISPARAADPLVPVNPPGPYAPVPQTHVYVPVVQEVPAVVPYPVYPEPQFAPQAVSYQPQPVPQPLEIVVYNVADMVVGQGSGGDAHLALLSMLAGQSEEIALTLQAAAAAGGGETPQHAALEELAETIESTFAAEFEDDRGSITLHRGTLSLIVRQSESVHAQIRDLLDQLRRANDTRISVTIELVELDEVRMPFAFAHNGRVLDEAELAEFRGLAQQGEAEQLKFSITARNGESTSMPAYGLPGTLTAVASPDRREVRVLLDMIWGDVGYSQKFNHRVPAGGSILTIYTVEGSGYVVLLSAEIEEQEELEDALFGPEDSTLLPATHAEPAPPSEPVSQVPGTQILTQALLVEVDSLPENFLGQLGEHFDCVAQPARECPGEPCAVVLESATGNDLLLALQKDQTRMQIISRPQIVMLGGETSQIQVGQVVPVIDGIRFENDLIVPIAREQEVGTVVSLVPSVAADGCIELQLHATRTNVLEEEVVLYSAPGQTITSPIVDTVEARATLTAPQGKTLVWPVPPTGGAESDGPTLLIFLTSHLLECDEASH